MSRRGIFGASPGGRRFVGNRALALQKERYERGEKKLRRPVGISGLQAGEDVKRSPVKETGNVSLHVARCNYPGQRSLGRAVQLVSGLGLPGTFTSDDGCARGFPLAA